MEAMKLLNGLRKILQRAQSSFLRKKAHKTLLKIGTVICRSNKFR